MLFQFVGWDGPGAQDIRRRTRGEHLQYLVDRSGPVRFGGPLLEDGAPVGSTFLLEVSSRDEAEAWLADDPYTRAGLFGRSTLYAVRQVVPETEPGALQAELAAERAANP